MLGVIAGRFPRTASFLSWILQQNSYASCAVVDYRGYCFESGNGSRYRISSERRNSGIGVNSIVYAVQQNRASIPESVETLRSSAGGRCVIPETGSCVESWEGRSCAIVDCGPIVIGRNELNLLRHENSFLELCYPSISDDFLGSCWTLLLVDLNLVVNGPSMLGSATKEG